MVLCPWSTKNGCKWPKIDQISKVVVSRKPVDVSRKPEEVSKKLVDVSRKPIEVSRKHVEVRRSQQKAKKSIERHQAITQCSAVVSESQ